MPSIRYIRKNPPSPIRRYPRNVDMSKVEPSPYLHKACNKPAILYADGVIWCERCGGKIEKDNCTDLSRRASWNNYVLRSVPPRQIHTPKRSK